MIEVFIGRVVHCNFSNIKVAVIALVEQLEVGDTVHIKTPQKKRQAIEVDFVQKIISMQIEGNSN